VTRIAVALLLLVGARGAEAAEDPARAIPADAVVVASARPLALLGVAARVGSGWDKLVRRALPIPPAVNPFDASLLTTLGIDPAATAWAALRGLRGHLHLRAILTLSDPRLDEAVVRSGAAVAGAKLEHQPSGAWIGREDDRLIVVRTDGHRLIVDLLLRGAGVLPSAAELQRLAPLAPPRAFDPARGLARRLGPADAVAIWIDLAGAATLGLTDAEVKLARALKGVAAEMRAKLERAGRAEIATCRAALKTAPATFDDALLAIELDGPNTLRLEAALGGKRDALARLRERSGPVSSTYALLPADSDADLRVTVADAGPLRAAMRPAPGGLKGLVPRECSGPTGGALGLRVWPALLARASGEAGAGRERGTAAMLRLFTGLRGAALWLPTAPTTTPAAPSAEAVGPREVLAFAEIDDAVRGDLDRLLSGSFGATTPLRASGRQLTAYTPPTFPWSSGEGPLVAVDTITDPVGGAVIGFGPRERLKGAFEHLTRASVQSARSTPILVATATAKAFSRVQRQLELRGGTEGLFDGIGQLDVVLALEEELLRLDFDLSLRPLPQGR
jgi:hypothetical protein